MGVLYGSRRGMGALQGGPGLAGQTPIAVTVKPSPTAPATTVFIAPTGSLTNLGAASLIKQAQLSGGSAVLAPSTAIAPAPFTGISQAQFQATSHPTFAPLPPVPQTPPAPMSVWVGTPAPAPAPAAVPAPATFPWGTVAIAGAVVFGAWWFFRGRE